MHTQQHGMFSFQSKHTARSSNYTFVSKSCLLDYADHIKASQLAALVETTVDKH
jgi:hypothetical protein